MDQPSADRLEEERRRLWDRRSPAPLRQYTDRRDSDRRCATREPHAEHRGGAERRRGEGRRSTERRTNSDRRRGVRSHVTPVPFTPEQLGELQARCAARGPVRCPACESRVSLGPIRRGATEMVRMVMCLGCSRGAVVPDAGAARVLVVGANEALRDILKTTLSLAGHDVTEAADAGVGLAAYAAVPADVVLLDVRATGRMDAPEFVRRLRASSPGARVVALLHRSSKETTDPTADTRDLGAVATLQMPVSREDLLQAVDEARAPG